MDECHWIHVSVTEWLSVAEWLSVTERLSVTEWMNVNEWRSVTEWMNDWMTWNTTCIDLRYACFYEVKVNAIWSEKKEMCGYPNEMKD